MADKLRAGAATANITPWLGIAMRGAFRDVTHADTVHDELLAKALVLDDGARQLAFVLCDLTMISRDMMEAVKERIAARTGIAPDNVLIASTHTHSAPATVSIGFMDEQTEYTAWATRKIADSVELAVQRLQPARIGFANVQEPRLVFNRRFHMRNGQVQFNPGVGNPDVLRPAGTTDPAFTLCYVESSEGEPLAVLGNYALHYVGTDSGTEISADYYGHFFRAIQHLLGPQTVGLLFNGASGNINNTNVFTPWPHRGHAQAARMAKVLAGHVLTEIQLMQMHDHVALGAAVSAFDFPRKQTTDQDVAIAEKVLSGNFAYAEGPFSAVPGQPIYPRWAAAYAREVKVLHTMPQVLTSTLQAFRVGPAGFAALPGEIFVEVGLAIKESTPFAPQFVLGLANDYLGYVATDEQLALGAYETWPSRSAIGGPGTGQAMEARALELLNGLADG
ncbi:MAG: neutral/alkaline non-lysosomal ceramidase N-terminal domain-containing protein [Chloroflexi bacterium]|nr:neutral/alkaline non-lysosomal ceramidase N-terminal domain-containing protein [Chloroflexota bacterium]